MTEILSLSKEHERSTVFGVTVFILDPKKRVFTFIEQEHKPWTGKNIGDYSVMCETREKGEVAMLNTLRGAHEETGISNRDICSVLDLHNVRVWETEFMPGVWTTVSVINCSNPAKMESLIGSDCKPDGVVIGGWKTRDELEALPVRIGVRNVLDKFADEIFAK